MELTGLTWIGPASDDPEILRLLPPDLAKLLSQVNGFVLRGGALHLRGAVRAPAWHSMANAWQGPRAFHLLYPGVSRDDIPFAQNCLGDQFLLRHGSVVRLSAEDGEFEPFNVDLFAFLANAMHDPIEYLRCEPLATHFEDGGQLEPGQLLIAYPPYCTRESSQGTMLKAVPASDAIEYLADFARQIRDLRDGTKIRLGTVD